VGATVTREPSTLTFRKWKTWSIEVGRAAPPHALPPRVYDQPTAYATGAAHLVAGCRRAPPPPVTYVTRLLSLGLTLRV
jgi:hypothetical protein